MDSILSSSLDIKRRLGHTKVVKGEKRDNQHANATGKPALSFWKLLRTTYQAKRILEKKREGQVSAHNMNMSVNPRHALLIHGKSEGRKNTIRSEL